MTAEQLKGAIHKQPFRPFVIHAGSGEKYPVNHPEQIMISPSGKTVGVFLDNEDNAIIDMASITEFVASPSRSTKRK